VFHGLTALRTASDALCMERAPDARAPGSGRFTQRGMRMLRAVWRAKTAHAAVTSTRSFYLVFQARRKDKIPASMKNAGTAQ